MKRKGVQNKDILWITEKGRTKHHLTADSGTSKLDKHFYKQDHKGFVVCDSLPWSDNVTAESVFAGWFDIVLVLKIVLHTVA